MWFLFEGAYANLKINERLAYSVLPELKRDFCSMGKCGRNEGDGRTHNVMSTSCMEFTILKCHVSLWDGDSLSIKNWGNSFASLLLFQINFLKPIFQLFSNRHESEKTSGLGFDVSVSFPIQDGDLIADSQISP